MIKRLQVRTLAIALLAAAPCCWMAPAIAADASPRVAQETSDQEYFVWDGDTAPAAQALPATTLGTTVGSNCYGADFYDCNSYATTPARRGGFYAGGEVLWFKVFNQGDNAVSLVAPGTQRQYVPFDADFELTGRGWAGYRGPDGFGVRGTYWEFDHAVSAISGVAPAGMTAQAVATNSQGAFLFSSSGIGGGYSAGYGLEMNVLDLDFTHELEVGSVEVVLAGGARYAHYSSDYGTTLTNAAGAFTGAVLYNHGFSGGGPTFSIEARRNLGDTGLAMHAGFRQSIVFGNADESIYAEPGSRVLVGSADESLSITQLRVGVEYGVDVGLNMRAFGRLGYEAQFWHGAGTATDGQLDLGLQGFAATAGIEL